MSLRSTPLGACSLSAVALRSETGVEDLKSQGGRSRTATLTILKTKALGRACCGFTLFAALCVPMPMWAADVVWTNSSGGNWSSAANWSGGTVPGPSDNALITSVGNYTVTLDVDASVASLTLGGATGTQSFSIPSHTLTLQSTSSIGANGVIALIGGILAGVGPVTNRGALNIDNGTINATLVNQGLLVFRGFGGNVNGAFENQAGATMRVLGDGSFSGAQLTMAQGFTNYGLIELTSVVNAQPATLNVTSGSLGNAAGAVINVLAGAGNGGRLLGAQLDNEGIVNVGSSLTMNKSGVAHVNSGSILVTNGDLTLSQSGSPGTFSSTGTIAIGAGLNFIVSGGTLNYNSGSIGGAGTLSLNSATANFVPDFSDAVTGLSLATATINGPGKVTNTAGKTLNIDNATINATLVNQGLLVFRGFGGNVNGTFENQAGATLRVLGDGGFSGAQLTMAQGFTNYGLIELTSVVNAQPATLNVTSGSLGNAAGAVINVLAGAGNGGRLLGAQLDNEGIVNVGSSLTMNKSGVAHVNSGSILVTNGDLTLSQSGSPGTFSSTGTIAIGTGLNFIVSGGTLNYNSGNIGGAGTLSLNSATANFVPDFSDAVTGLSLATATINGPGKVTNTAGKTLNIDNATINATLVNQGLLVFRGFGGNVNGAFENQAGATLRVLGDGGFSGAQLTMAQGFTNYGLIELTSVVNAQPATLNVTSGSLGNAAGAVINVLAGAGNGGRLLGAQLDNEGIVNVGSSLTMNKSGVAHVNSGSILVTNGDLTLSQSGSPGTFSSTGTIAIGTGLNFIVSGGTLNYNSGNIGGAGTLSLNSATANFVPDFSDAVTGLSLATATINGPGKVTNTAGKTLNIDNATINATLVNQGLLVFRGFGGNVNGAFENQAGATMRVLGDGSFSGAQLTMAQGFTNYGLIELTSVVNAQPATLNVTSGSLGNAAGAVINVLAGAGNGGRLLGAQLDNEGIVNVGSSLTMNKSGVAHVNSGSILVTNGDLTLSQSGSPGTFSSTGTIAIGTGLNFIVSGGTLNYNSGNIGGAGTLSLNSATANFVPDFSDAVTGLSLATATINGPGKVTNTAGKTLNIDNATINATLVNQGLLVFRGFGGNVNGAFENQAGATMRVLGDGSFSGAQLTMAQGFTNYGLIELTSVVNAQPATLNVTSGSLGNAAGAVINVLAGAGNGGRLLGAQLDNEGIVNVGSSLTINQNAAALADKGTINVSGGQTLQVNGGKFQIDPGGVLQGNGTLDALNTSFTNAGIVNPGAAIGTLSILGSYPQVSSGTINVEIGGRTAGLEYDQLQISGKATLAGTLNIGLTNGFRPNGGDRFEVIQNGANALAFDHINGLDLGGGLFLQPSFSATNLVLVTVDTRPQVVFETPKRLSGGAVQITLDGTAGRDFVIEATTNLVPAVWIPIVTSTNSGAVFNLILLDATNIPVRFFRFKQ